MKIRYSASSIPGIIRTRVYEYVSGVATSIHPAAPAQID